MIPSATLEIPRALASPRDAVAALRERRSRWEALKARVAIRISRLEQELEQHRAFEARCMREIDAIDEELFGAFRLPPAKEMQHGR